MRLGNMFHIKVRQKIVGRDRNWTICIDLRKPPGRKGENGGRCLADLLS